MLKDNEYIAKDHLHILVCGNIKKYRTLSGMTQLELSERIGMSHEYLRQLESEKGQKDFSFYTLYKISLALKTPLDDFIKP